MIETATQADYSDVTLIDEWKREQPGVFSGRDGWGVRKVRSNSGYSWIITRPDGSTVRDRHNRGIAWKSALSAQLAAGPMIREAATTRAA